ncbi:alanine racemase [Sporofaciens sp. SGI.106]|uniref:alanine racemase n=1 Tax=Sporofaciens sp. SGI.106 TaxID=3420568 RepID=UPI002A9A144C|nr:alanine racemase [Lachnoclostridium sp.]
MKKYSRVCARVNLDAIEYNMEMMRRNLHPDTKMIAVVKTDAYGHGAVQVGRILEPRDYVWGYAVATADEALFMREHDLMKPILVLGCVFPEQRRDMIERNIRVTCYTEEMAQDLSNLAVEMGKKAYVHIKLDTGMGRLGFLINEENAEIIRRIASMPNLVMEGMYTHFAKADETDKTFTQKQIEKYQWMRQALTDRGVNFEFYHCSNSAGIIDMKEANMDLARAGISTYGMYPSEEVVKENVPLKPAMELISHVTHVKWVEKGATISYGATYVADSPRKIATIPVGYGDGYPRSLSNKGAVLIHGRRAPICGRICMDQFMVDVTDIEDVKFGDKVVLVGFDGEEHIPVEELSDLSGRFNYEFVCCLSKRIPREYLRNGEVVKQIDYFT